MSHDLISSYASHLIICMPLKSTWAELTRHTITHGAGDGGSRDYAGISLWQDPQQTPSHVPDPSDSVAGTTMELYRSIPAMDEDTAAAHTPAVRYQYGDEVVGQQQQPVQQEEAEEAEEGSEQEVVVELPCAHSFHRSCIIQWATAHDSCPVCRAQLDPPDEQHADL